MIAIIAIFLLCNLCMSHPPIQQEFYVLLVYCYSHVIGCKYYTVLYIPVAMFHFTTNILSYSSNNLHTAFLEYRLVIICSSNCSRKPHIVLKLQRFRRTSPQLPPVAAFRDYLLEHFTSQSKYNTCSQRINM